MPFCPADPRQEAEWTRRKKKKASHEGNKEDALRQGQQGLVPPLAGGHDLGGEKRLC